LGFASIRNRDTGAWTGAGGFPDAFSHNLKDLDIGKTWPEMTDQERLDSSSNDPHLVWTGGNVTSESANLLEPTVEVVVNSPPSIAGVYPSALGDEPTIVIPPNGVTGDVLDGSTLNELGSGDPADGCEQLEFSADLTDKIVLFDLPSKCPPTFPPFYAEFQSAAGVIIADTAGSGLPDIGGQISNQEIVIPYVGVEKSLGVALRSAMAGTAPPGLHEIFSDSFENPVNTDPVNVTIRRSQDALMGQNDNKLRMYAPAVLEIGSSVSHWTTEAKPDLLMEPVLSKSLIFGDVDLTLAAFQDMGWKKN
jgi:hypothetical protein